MKPSSLLQFSKLVRIFRKTTLKPHPSEIQGLVCGLLCGKKCTVHAWQTLAIGEDAPTEAKNAFNDLIEISSKQLADFSFEFNLILPNDDESLAERAESLRLFCEGFIIGLEKAKIKITGRAQSDTTEAIDDIIAISQMSFDPANDEEDEVAYVQLVEYVRMATVLVYQNEHDVMNHPSPDSSSNLH